MEQFLLDTAAQAVAGVMVALFTYRLNRTICPDYLFLKLVLILNVHAVSVLSFLVLYFLQPNELTCCNLQFHFQKK